MSQCLSLRPTSTKYKRQFLVDRSNCLTPFKCTKGSFLESISVGKTPHFEELFTHFPCCKTLALVQSCRLVVVVRVALMVEVGGPLAAARQRHPFRSSHSPQCSQSCLGPTHSVLSTNAFTFPALHTLFWDSVPLTLFFVFQGIQYKAMASLYELNMTCLDKKSQDHLWW